MSPEEAKTFGIPEEDRRLYVRVDRAKVNIARAAGGAKWFRLVGVPLGNATDLYTAGDEVQTAEPWKPPETWADIDKPMANLTSARSGSASAMATSTPTPPGPASVRRGGLSKRTSLASRKNRRARSSRAGFATASWFPSSTTIRSRASPSAALR